MAWPPLRNTLKIFAPGIEMQSASKGGLPNQHRDCCDWPFLNRPTHMNLVALRWQIPELWMLLHRWKHTDCDETNLQLT